LTEYEFSLERMAGIQFAVDECGRILMVMLSEKGKEYPLLIFPDVDEFVKFVESCREFLQKIRTEIPEAFRKWDGG